MNAVVIQQSEDEMKLAVEVHLNAAISRVRVSRGKLVSRTLDDAFEAPVSIDFNFRSKQVPGPTNVLRLDITFRMAGVEEAEDQKREEAVRKFEPVILVECAYEVDYALREGFLITPGHVKAFKNGNAIFNTSPYFREFLQNSLQRMGLPPLRRRSCSSSPSPSEPQTRLKSI